MVSFYSFYVVCFHAFLISSAPLFCKCYSKIKTFFEQANHIQQVVVKQLLMYVSVYLTHTYLVSNCDPPPYYHFHLSNSSFLFHLPNPPPPSVINIGSPYTLIRASQQGYIYLSLRRELSGERRFNTIGWRNRDSLFAQGIKRVSCLNDHLWTGVVKELAGGPFLINLLLDPEVCLG